MNIGISTWVWTSPATTPVLENLIPKVAEMGFDQVELPIEEPGAFDVARVRELIDTNGLAVSVCAVIGEARDLLVAETCDEGIGYVRTCVDVAEQLGASRVIGPLYSAVGRCWRMLPGERSDSVERLAEILHGLGAYAGDRGVTLGVEPLNRFETSFLNTTGQAIELIERVDHAAVGLNLDLFHMGIEEKDVAAAIRQAGPHLKHLQVAENDRGTPGTGHLPWESIAAALRDIGYDGAVIIETFSDEVEAIARAAAIWRPLAESPDALAREGRAFLSELMERVQN